MTLYQLIAQGRRTPAGCLVRPNDPPGKHVRLRFEGRLDYLHRLVWVDANGPVPPGKVVRHTCDNPPCFEEGHLILGTQADNLRDARGRGRAVAPPIHRGSKQHLAKLTEAGVLEMRRRAAAGETASALAREFGVSAAAAWNAINGKTWAHV